MKGTKAREGKRDVDGSAVKAKKNKKKPVEPEDCTSNQEVADKKLKKKAFKKQMEEVTEVEEEKQTEDTKENKKRKRRKYEFSSVTEGSGENFTEVVKRKKDNEDHETPDKICVTKRKKKKKAETVVAEQEETEPCQEDACEADKVTRVKKMKKSKKEKTPCVEKVESEDEATKKKKKKKAKSKKNETEEDMESEEKVKTKKSETSSVEVTEVGGEVPATKKKKKKKDPTINGAEEKQVVDCEEEKSEMRKVGEKKKKKIKKSEEAVEEDKCDTGTKKRKKNKTKTDKQQESSQVDVVPMSEKCVTDGITVKKESRRPPQEDIDQESPAATLTKPQGFGQWSTAQFDSNDQQQKFLRLMGGFKKGFQPASGTPGKANMALGKDAQQQLQQGLLGQFEQAHSRRIDFGSRGAGLGFTAPSNKKFFIDVNASRSVRFDD